MIYVYRPASSTGARELADALGGRRWKRTRPALRAGDAVVAWGARLAPIQGVKILNGAPLRTKYEDAILLKQENVPTVSVSLQPGAAGRPGTDLVDPRRRQWEAMVELAGQFQRADFRPDERLYQDVVRELGQGFVQFERVLRNPPPPPPPLRVWLPRRNNHVGGADLLTRCPNPDYYALQEDLVREFRVHSFLGRSLRAGIKVAREGFVAGRNLHQWVRSWDGGWRISYDGVSSKRKHREIAHAAVKALGLDFGAVDIGEKADGSLIVLEVNRAPGLEGGTITAYKQAIEGWLRR